MDHFFRFIFALVLLQSTSFREANVSVSVGEDCVLPCSGHEGVKVLVLEWTELDRRYLLLLYRAGRVQDGYEHPVYTNRVQLLDPELQNGNFSVMLKNVTFNDTGTYRCLAVYEDDLEISQFIRLNVTEPETPTPTTGTEPTEGLGTGGVIAIVIGLIVVIGLILIGFILYRKIPMSLFGPRTVRAGEGVL